MHPFRKVKITREKIKKTKKKKKKKKGIKSNILKISYILLV